MDWTPRFKTELYVVSAAAAIVLAILFIPYGSMLKVDVTIDEGSIVNAQYSKSLLNVAGGFGQALSDRPAGNYGVVVSIILHYSKDVPYGTTLGKNVEYPLVGDGRYDFYFANVDDFEKIRVELVDRTGGGYRRLDIRELG